VTDTGKELDRVIETHEDVYVVL
ncbi:uncharacterized protein METZ01_LOCUS216062, partial [marine metagenome]